MFGNRKWRQCITTKSRLLDDYVGAGVHANQRTITTYFEREFRGGSNQANNSNNNKNKKNQLTHTQRERDKQAHYSALVHSHRESLHNLLNFKVYIRNTFCDSESSAHQKRTNPLALACSHLLFYGCCCCFFFFFGVCFYFLQNFDRL